MQRYRINVSLDHEIRQTMALLGEPGVPAGQIGLIAIAPDLAGEWVRFTDVAEPAKYMVTHRAHIEALVRERDEARIEAGGATDRARTAERERDTARQAIDQAEMETAAAREAQRAAEAERQRYASELRTERTDLVNATRRAETAEADLRAARAEVAELRAHLIVHDRLAASAMSYLRGEGITLQAAAPPAAEPWCYDMARAPRDGEVIELMCHFPAVVQWSISYSAWIYAGTGTRTEQGITYGDRLRFAENAYAWRRVQAPPREPTHQVPPVGSKL